MHEKETDDKKIRQIESTVNALPTSERLFTKVKPRTKEGEGTDYLESENLLTPEGAVERVRGGKNIGFRLGYEISGHRAPVTLDGDDPSLLSEEVIRWANEYAVVEWSSLHEGQNWLFFVSSEAYTVLDEVKTKVDVDNDGEHELEILTDNHAIAPGSAVDHKHCRASKSCDGTGSGTYDLLKTAPNAPVADEPAIKELLTLLDVRLDREVYTDASPHEPRELPSVNDDLVAVGEAHIRDFQRSASGLAFDDLMDLLNGGTGSIEGLRHDNNTIDRDKADLEALWMLYGIMRHAGETSERACELTHAVYTHYCSESQYVKDRTGRPRKWVDEREGDGYRRNRLNRAIEQHKRDGSRWLRWMRRKSPSGGSDGPLPFSGERSELVYDAVLISLYTLVHSEPTGPDAKDLLELWADAHDFALPDDYTIPSSPHPSGHKVCTPLRGSDDSRREPTAKEVGTLANTIDPSRKESTHREALRELQREHGQVRMAYCPSRNNGSRYVYYPASMTDPEDAKSVKIGGEEQEPDLEQEPRQSTR